MRIKTFLVKYKRAIIFWIVFLLILLYFAPVQYDYYLDDDIDKFKKDILVPILTWTALVLSVLIFLITFFTTRSTRKAGVLFLSAGITIVFFLFIFQDVFLAGSLFINRQFKHNSLQRAYVASYLVGTSNTKENFCLYDLSAKRISTERKLINKLYNPALKEKDTVTIQFNTGLFGIAYHPKPFDNK